MGYLGLDSFDGEMGIWVCYFFMWVLILGKKKWYKKIGFFVCHDWFFCASCN